MLLSQDPSLVTANIQGYSALLVAAQKGHTAVVRELVLHGADKEEKREHPPLIGC